MGGGVSGGDEVMWWDGEWCGSEVVCDVSGDLLKDLWCLCLTKKAGGVVVEDSLPLNHHIGVHCWV